MTVIEIRTYRLRPGTLADYHRVVTDQVMPLLAEFGVRVVRYGPSEQGEDGVTDYVLIRAFESHAERDAQEERFYGSAQWRDGPREAIMSRIESYHTVVLTAAASAAEALRQP